MSTPSEIYYQTLLVTSNGFFLWPVVEAVLAGEYYVAVMLFFTFGASTFYHICGIVASCHLGAAPRQLDFIQATNVICLTVLYWSGLTNLKQIGYSNAKYAWATVATMSLYVLCIIAVLFGNFDSFVYMAAILGSIGLLFLRFVVFAPQDTSDDLAIRGIYRLEYFILTSPLGIIGVLLFFADNWIPFDSYDETHPFWHIFIACTIGLAVRGVRYRQQYDALRQRQPFEKRQVAHRRDLGDAGPLHSLSGTGHTKDVTFRDEDLIV